MLLLLSYYLKYIQYVSCLILYYTYTIPHYYILYIGNLDPDIDEKSLYDTFSAFGGILQTPKIMRDSETGLSKGYGFVSYESFEASDLAIESMNGQYLSNRVIVCQYAFKKDTPGERHGSQAERLLAASQPQRFKPNTLFAGGAGDTITNVGSTATIAGLQFHQQQMQQQMQLTAYGALPYGQMPPPMQMMNMPMMPSAPSTLPGYLMQMQMLPQQQQPMYSNAYNMLPPPPPPPQGFTPTPPVTMSVPPPYSNIPPPPPPPPM